MNWPFVSVVILNYNGKKYLERCLKSVLNSNYPDLEVLLADNGSNDGSMEYATENFSHDHRLKIISNGENLGVAEGFNTDVYHARGKYIVFQENDIEVDHGWLGELIRVMESDPMIGAVQGKGIQIHFAYGTGAPKRYFGT